MVNSIGLYVCTGVFMSLLGGKLWDQATKPALSLVNFIKPFAPNWFKNNVVYIGFLINISYVFIVMSVLVTAVYMVEDYFQITSYITKKIRDLSYQGVTTPVKRIKNKLLGITEVSLDPFKRIEEEALFDNIFQHLTASEILTLSEVSPDYSALVAGSRKCLEKIALVISEKTIQTKFDEHFQRNYKHLKVIHIKSKRPISEQKHDAAVKKEKLVKFLKEFSGSLVTVNINGVLDNNDEEITGLKMEKLEELTINTPNNLINLITNAPKLKKLVIGFGTCSHEDLLTFIQKFPTVDSLHVRLLSFHKLFDQDISSQIGLKLRKIEVFRIPDFATPRINDNFEAFLLSQVENLKEIDIIGHTTARLLNFIFNQMKAQRVAINALDQPMLLNIENRMHSTELIIKNVDDGVITMQTTSSVLRNELKVLDDAGYDRSAARGAQMPEGGCHLQ